MYPCLNDAMGNNRLISLAAGVIPELLDNPCQFVEIAALAGWKGTGVWFDPSTWTDATTREVKMRIDDTGLETVDMEVVRMGPSGDCGEGLIEAALTIGAKNILTVSSYDSLDLTAERLTELCSLASEGNIRVCLEFMRFTSVKNLSDALKTVSMVEATNVGILVDLLHVHRSGTSYEEIAACDPSLFPYVQWCDGLVEPCGWSDKELIRDALDDRSIPGEGELPVLDFADLFDISVPFAIETRSRALRESHSDFEERAKHLLDVTLATLTI